jgi:hypothetical protein
MSILEALKKVAVNVLDPNRQSDSQELSFLKEVYYNRDGNLRPGQWYRLLSETGNCVGFAHYCHCGQERKLLSAWEWFRQYKCPQCKDDFELLKFVGIDPASTPPAQWKSICDAKLPARPGVAGKQTPSAVDIWGDSDDTGIHWGGPADRSRERGINNANPGYSGLF